MVESDEDDVSEGVIVGDSEAATDCEGLHVVVSLRELDACPIADERRNS